MSVTLEARKPINQITAADLDAYAIWEFAIDEEDIKGRDETWVRPVPAVAIPLDAYSLSVSADYETASGQTLRGLVGVSTVGGLEFSHGAVFVEGRYMFVPSSGYGRAQEPRALLSKALATSEAKVFPLRFKLRVPIAGEVTLRAGAFE